MYFVTAPQQFDVIVTDNLFGDILTALGAAVAGGIGLAASASINPSAPRPARSSRSTAARRTWPGKQKADPTAAIMSAAMLCDHLGLRPRRQGSSQAVADDLVERQGAWAARSTPEIGDDTCRAGDGIAPAAIGWANGAAIPQDGNAGTGSGRGRGGPGNGATPAARRTAMTASAANDGTAVTASNDDAATEISFALHPSGSPLPGPERARILESPGFGRAFTDHMITIRWTAERGWYDGQLEPYGPISLPPATSYFTTLRRSSRG